MTAISKVTLNGKTLIDATLATANADKIIAPYTAITADGILTEGTAKESGDELYKLINGTIADSEIDWSKVTTPKSGAFWNCSQITSVDNPTIDTFRTNIFRNCANLTKIEVGVTGQTLRYEGDVMRDNPKLTEVTIHFLYSQNPNNYIVFGGTYFLVNNPLLTTVTFDVPYAKFTLAASWMFNNDPALRNIVIKSDKAVAGLEGVWAASAWGGIYNNPTESTIWVPQALISSYQTATNWSNLYAAGVTFAPIEGSIYDD